MSCFPIMNAISVHITIIIIMSKVWDVKAVENNNEDVSYGTDCLNLHMDEPYYDGQPGINFLHCIRCSTLIFVG